MTTQPIRSAGEPPQNGRQGEAGSVTLAMVRDSPRVKAYIRMADAALEQIGYTEHGERHASLVANIAQNILKRLGYAERTTQLTAIAGYLHDIGNVVHREEHAHSSAIIAMDVLRKMRMPPEEIAIVMGAIGNHEEERGDPVGEISAAVIIADKADVHRSRVRNPNTVAFDIHDRVNYAAQRSFVRVDGERKTISLEVDIDTTVSKVMEYFEIFMTRMIIARRAAAFLGCQFEVIINKTKML